MINIYAYQNKITGKIYIGQTIETLYERARFGTHYKGCTGFYNAIKKYGWSNFEGWIFRIVDSQEEADQEEIFWISEMKNQLGNKNVYNIRLGGSRGKHSEISKQKMREAVTGRIHSEESKQKMRKPKSDETRLKMSLARKGKTPWNKGIVKDNNE